MLVVVLACHILAGLTAVVSGASAMLASKGGRRHRRRGIVFYGALTVVCVTATILAIADWAHLWHLFLLAVAAYAFASIGYAARLMRWRGWVAAHIAGMGMGYITMLTAFYVDNGPRLPVWNLLPPIAFWFLPSVVGLPLLIRSLARRRRSAAVGSGPAGRS